MNGTTGEHTVIICGPAPSLLSLTLSLWETLKPQLSHSPRPKPKETTTYEEESHISPLVAASELTLGFKSVMVLLQMRGMLTF